ncbi:YafY family transcriptional regulator [Plantactinospora sp. S1510]|uniref:YafY family transcriptional regulator n=1 Tax=Plantactinospora alkalitolerans TaxID=2789879 RepID=A0ABS0GS12_9ACTN|nr:YafY family protein [Plantactinospora alkalitolerans]MBF9128981.1 YafY family transcriptional regulator [Plantactinospora alkalitolerans]
MAHPAARVLGMLELLQSHHRLTGPELAARLDVDQRTVRRYADTLVELGIPVLAARGRYGGYRLRPGYKLPPLMLTDDEAVAVLLGLVAAEHLGLGTAAPATDLAQAKIRRVLPTSLAERLDAVQETLGLSLRRRADTPRPATATLLALGAATRSRHRVSIGYRSWGGEASQRDLDPYGLVFHSGRWYVTGHDHLRGQIRTFRLDRIGSVDVGTATFSVPDGFDPVGHVTRSLAGVAYRWEVEVLLEADLEQARRRVPPSVAELTATDDGILLRTRAEDLTGMAQMLAGLGWPFTVVRPDELRAAVGAYAALLAGYAERSPGPVIPA